MSSPLKTIDKSQDFSTIFNTINENIDLISEYMGKYVSTKYNYYTTLTNSSNIINLPDSYTPNNNCIEVYLNGKRLITGVDFDETSSKVVTLKNSLVINNGDKLDCYYVDKAPFELSSVLTHVTLESPNGKVFKVTVDDEGRLTTTRI